MNNVDRVFKEASSPAQFARKYLDYLSTLLSTLDDSSIGSAIELMEETRNKDRKIIFIGNGGSAATSSHFVNDIAVGTGKMEKPYKAVGLTDNIAVITAIANDFGYEEVFLRQMQYTLEDGDLVVAISASGNSPNVIKAVEYARSRGSKVVGLVGFDGGKLKELSDVVLHAVTPKGEYGPVEDVHMVMDHLIMAYLCRRP